MKALGSNTFVLVCPFCNGKEAFKFLEKDSWRFLCHDCQRYMPFDKTGVKDGALPSIATNNNINFSNLLNLCTLVSELEPKHEFRKYCEYRRIPLDRVYYTDRFDELSNYAETPVKDKERIVFPIYNSNNELVGVTGRCLPGKSDVRYITLMFNKDESKLFGRERVDMSKEFLAVEGPVDSLFLKNCIAMNGAEGLDNKYATFATICFDNEPRNKEIVAKMKRSLEAGFKVVVWPKSIKQKDINDMVLNNYNPQEIIANNSFSGLSGILKLNEWKK